MSAHTPGPWHVVTIDGSIGSVEAEDGSAVAQAQPRGTLRYRNHDERRANANLIAAAPDLLAALNRFDVEGLELEGDEEIDITMTAEDLRILRAAIAKAKGGKP